MSLSEKELQRWLDVVQTWHGANSAEGCSNTAKALNELSSFLKDLERAIAEAADNSQLILQKFPSVGKLLGELFKNTTVLLSDEVFQMVVRCSLAMAYCSGMQGRNTEKAKKWMIAQLRCATTPVLPNSNLIEFGEYWGFTGQECMEMMVDKLVSSICHDLEVMKNFTWNSDEKECYPDKPVSGQCLRELSEFCLPLVNCPQAKPLVERILCCQKSLDLISSEHENSLCVFDSVSVVFLKAVASRRDLLLSYEARTALWKRYQPSFESEILDLIEMSTVQHPTMSKEQMQDAISSRELPRACAENPELFTLSMNILSSFLARSCGSSQATKLLSVFGELCIKECNHGTRI